jgi:hypothetical protein
MPLTVTVSEGVLAKHNEQPTLIKLCEAMLKWHGLEGNRAMTPNVVGSIHVLKRGQVVAGLQEAQVAFIEWKVPAFAFTDRKVQQGYAEEATNIVHEASGGTLPKSHIWVNVVHAVDGAWSIAGEALTNQQLIERISKG